MTPSPSTMASVGLGVPASTLISWILNVTLSVEVPGEVQAAMGALISAIIGMFFLGGKRADVT